MRAVSGGSSVAVLLITLALALSWPAEVLGNALQLLGTFMALLGVDIVWSGAQVASDKAIEAKQGLSRWYALRRGQLLQRWARLRKRPVTFHRGAFDAVAVSDAVAEVTVRRRRVNRETVSDREWLAFLDERVESIFELMDQAEKNRSAEREDVNRRLAIQRDELRAEIRRETRQGWQLIVTGLVWSVIGIAIAIV